MPLVNGVNGSKTQFWKTKKKNEVNKGKKEENTPQKKSQPRPLRIKTQVCKVDGSENPFLAYCGYSLKDLVAENSFELVADLLLHNKLPTSEEKDLFTARLKEHDDHLNFLKPIIEAACPNDIDATEPSASLGMSRLSTLTTLLNTITQWPNDEACAVDLLTTLPVGILAWHHFSENKNWDQFNENYENAKQHDSYAARFLHLLHGKAPTNAEIKAFNGVLSCYAEHGFNASTTAACASISTKAPLALAVASAINTLIGPLHGGANLNASELILQFNTLEEIKPWVQDFFARDDHNKEEGNDREKLHGFGHAVYKYFDPRVPIIKNLINELLASDPERTSCEGKSIAQLFARAEHLEACVKAEASARNKSLPANVDFYMAVLLEALHIPRYLFTVNFALGRMAGWMAHCMEYKNGGPLIRLKNGLKIEIEYVGRPLQASLTADSVDSSCTTVSNGVGVTG